MRLTVNGAPVELSLDSPSIAEVLQHLGYREAFAAIAVNLECVPRALLSSTPAREGDEIEVLEPHQGG